MLNKEDCEALDLLLNLAKTSDGIDSVDISYSKDLGWRVVAWPHQIQIDKDYDYIYKKERLADRCRSAIVNLVQNKLEG